MKTLIVADIHFGDDRLYDLKQLYNLLLTESYDRLILNGDIVDLWITSWADIIKSDFLKVIEIISNMRDVTWLIGNHDCDIIKNNISAFLPKVKIAEFFEMEEGGKKFLCLHGHQVYRNKEESLVTQLVTKLNYFIWKYTGIDIQKIHIGAKYYLRYTDMKHRQLIKRFGGNDRVIISGHTHRTEHLVVGGTELFDIGAFIKNGNYAIIDNGKVEIRTIK